MGPDDLEVWPQLGDLVDHALGAHVQRRHADAGAADDDRARGIGRHECQDLFGELHAERVVVVGDEEAHAGVGRWRGVDGDDGDAGVGGVLHGTEERVGGQALQDDAVRLGLGDGHEEGSLLAWVTRVRRGDLDLDARVQLADGLATVGHLYEGVRLGLPVDEPESDRVLVLGDCRPRCRWRSRPGSRPPPRARDPCACRGGPWVRSVAAFPSPPCPCEGVETAGPVLVRPVRQMDGAPRRPCLVSPAAQRDGAGAGRDRRSILRRG